MCEIYCLEMVIYDRQIAAIISYIRTRCEIFTTNMQYFILDVICIWLYMLVSVYVHVRFLVSDMQYIYQKWSDICMKWYSSQKTLLSCVVKFKQTTVISNIRQIVFESL